eukprot:4407157-Pyramimonas_sp.AAC.1
MLGSRRGRAIALKSPSPSRRSSLSHSPGPMAYAPRSPAAFRPSAVCFISPRILSSSAARVILQSATRWPAAPRPKRLP